MHRSFVWRMAAHVPATWRPRKVARLEHAAEMSEALGSASPADTSLRYAFLRHSDDTSASSATQRMSPAARLGSSKVDGNAIVSLPEGLRTKLEALVLASNKDQLRRDAMHVSALDRAHHDKTGLLPRHSQHFVHALPRQRAVPLYVATHFAARYAILVRVFDEARRRLFSDRPDGWRPSRLVDFSSHTSEALWACAHVFGPEALHEYVAEARSGTMLKAHVDLQDDDCWKHMRTTFRVRGDKPHVYRDVPLASVQDSSLTHPPTTQPMSGTTIGVHAFGLSSLSSDVARERDVLRTWKSDADVLVFIEDATPRGFACIAAARSQLLELGRRSPDRTCHVVAPCPHDQACPLLHASSSDMPRRTKGIEVCSYAQMYQVPPFMRATLRLLRGDAVSQYCYLIVQRGPRPSLASATHAWAHAMPKHLARSTQDGVEALLQSARTGVLDQIRGGGQQRVVVSVDRDEHEIDGDHQHHIQLSRTDIDACTSALTSMGVDERRVMQTDAYAWPRLIRPPLKKGGHVTMDACCATGDIRRFTMPKSAGRQAYQDARKALHGELYAHMQDGSRATVSIRAPSSGGDGSSKDSAQIREGAHPAHNTDAMTVPREAATTNDAPQPLVADAADVKSPAEQAFTEHMYLGPDAQYESRTTGRVSKRVSSRAPKRRRAIMASLDDEARSTRKQSRTDLEEALRLWSHESNT